jgi:hypothetical protein
VTARAGDIRHEGHDVAAAAEELPAPTTNHQRLVFGRIQSLTRASQQASASLQFANAQVTALTAEMEARRKAAAR